MQQLTQETFELSGQEIAIWCRPAPSTDRYVAQQVIGHHEYGFNQWRQGQLLHNLYHDLSKSRRAFFCDAGANIGTFTVYMRRWFSSYCFLAIEPDEENCSVFERNIGQDRNVTLFRGGLARTEGTLYLMRRKDWSHRLAEKGGDIAVKTIGPEYVLDFAKRNDAFPFVFKLDIEGGEADVFSGDTAWVNEFPLIVLELHDWMLPLKGTSQNVLRAVAKYDFEVTQRGENIFFFNRGLLKKYV